MVGSVELNWALLAPVAVPRPEHRNGLLAASRAARVDAHTNTAEGFFSLLKRGINGGFHHVSKGHLHRYCSEFEFRYNTRVKLGYSDSDRAALLVFGAEGKRLTYKKGAGASAA